MHENSFHNFQQDRRKLNVNFAYKKGNIRHPTKTFPNEFMPPSGAQCPESLGPFSPTENPIIALDKKTLGEAR